MKLITILALALTTIATQASGQSVDWKFYGGSKVGQKDNVCFYDATGIIKTGRVIKVWTKCLSMEEIDRIDIKSEYDGKILENTARKMKDAYFPPYMSIAKDGDLNKVLNIAEMEEVADVAGLDPIMRMYQELDCDQRRLRFLSIYAKSDGRSGSLNEAQKWQYIAPETNASNLLSLVCR